jgi:hypothetical protein
MLRRRSSLLLLFTAIFANALIAQNRPDAPEFVVKEHYTKYEYRIPMRDGVRLFTSVYVPKDSAHAYPFLIDRTPYSVGPYGVDLYRTQLGPSPEFDKAGYIFVFQDVRGRYMSEGTFIEMRPAICTTPSIGCSRMCRTITAMPESGAFRILVFSPRPASLTRIPRSKPRLRRLP